MFKILHNFKVRIYETKRDLLNAKIRRKEKAYHFIHIGLVNNKKTF